MDINVSISGANAAVIRDALRELIGDAAVPVVSGEAGTANPEPEIVAPPKKRGRPKKSDAVDNKDDVTDINTDGDSVEPEKPTTTTPGPSLGPQHEEARAVAREFNTKFGNDALLALLKQFKGAKIREMVENGNADAFIEAARAKLAETQSE